MFNQRLDSYQNENTLLTGVHQGDEQAFNQIFRHFYPVLCLFANRFLLKESIAKDLAQDALIKAWERRSDFESIPKLKSFLFTCVRNACFNELEKEKVQQKYQEVLANSGLDAELDTLEKMIHSEVVMRIFDQVDTLPEQCRKVIRMTFEEGKKPKEIAEELGISISNISSQKLRGLNLLKDKLSDHDFLCAVAIFSSAVWR